MADYYIEYAESFRITKEQAQVAKKLYAAISYVYEEFDGCAPDEIHEDLGLSNEAKQDIETYKDLAEDLQTTVADYGVDFLMDIQEEEDEEEPHLYLYVASDGGSSIEPVILFLVEVLNQSGDHTIWTLTWSVSCSKPRSGAFGGWGVAINLHGYKLTEKRMSDHKENLIQEFQCTGCMLGPAPSGCEGFELVEVDSHFYCNGHVIGTRLMGARSSLMCIGLPKGFNRVSGHKDKSEPHIRIHSKEGYKHHWNKFNVPVWAVERDGFLFVRTFIPRVDVTTVDVIEGGTLDMVPGAVNVGEFADEID